MGRLFDAAAALLAVCENQSFEGQAAMELEALVGSPEAITCGFCIDQNVLDFSPLLSAMLEPGLEARQGAAQFHGTLIAGLAEWIGRYAKQMGQTDVVLGGGCFMNRVLAEDVYKRQAHLHVLHQCDRDDFGDPAQGDAGHLVGQQRFNADGDGQAHWFGSYVIAKIGGRRCV